MVSSARRRCWRSAPGCGAAAVRNRAPYGVVILMTGLIAMVIGTLVGLPALRLRGLYLALITLMLAGRSRPCWRPRISPTAAAASSATTAPHPAPPIRRPAIAESDPAFLRYAIVVAAVMFGLVVAHLRTRPGAPGRRSARARAAALAAGIKSPRISCGLSRSLRS